MLNIAHLRAIDHVVVRTYGVMGHMLTNMKTAFIDYAAMKT